MIVIFKLKRLFNATPTTTHFKGFENQLSLYLLERKKIIALQEIKLILSVRKNLLFPSITIFQVLKQPLSRFERRGRLTGYIGECGQII